MSIPKEMFDILVCPLDRSNLEYNKDETKLICIKCKKAFPIEDGIPNMTP